MTSAIRTPVKLLDLEAQYQPLRAEILAAITRVCDSQQFILGPEVDAFERELSAHLGVPHAIAVSSGTDALLVALMALGIGAGDEVITSTFSFFATAGCIARLGARPVFIDIDSVAFNLDPTLVGAAITSRTRAIVPVHLYGLCADMDAILEVAPRKGFQSSKMRRRRLARPTSRGRRELWARWAAFHSSRARILGHSARAD